MHSNLQTALGRSVNDRAGIGSPPEAHVPETSLFPISSEYRENQ
jgi:hypothetical protein